MSWPPRVGEPLPRAAEAIGVRDKLLRYSLDATHESGGPKARAFDGSLGITAADIDYLEAAIRTGIRGTRITAIRGPTPYGFQCEVKWKLVEISEAEPPGATLDMLSLHESRLRLVAKH